MYEMVKLNTLWRNVTIIKAETIFNKPELLDVWVYTPEMFDVCRFMEWRRLCVVLQRGEKADVLWMFTYVEFRTLVNVKYVVSRNINVAFM